MSWDNDKKIKRPSKSIKPFASDSLSGERTLFGSNSTSDDLEQNLNSDYQRGWGIVPQDSPPTRQDFSASMFTTSQLSAYLFQQGIAEYTATQHYFIGSVCQYNGSIYIALTGVDDAPNVGNEPSTSTDAWRNLESEESTAWDYDAKNNRVINVGEPVDGSDAVTKEWALANLGGDGVTSFSLLTDTPDDMAGEGGKFLAVNVDEDALVYVDAPTGGGGVPADESLENKQMRTVDPDDGYLGIHASKLDMESIRNELGPIKKKDTYHALGDVIETPLTYAEFLGAGGDDSFVPVDGSDITGSDLAKLTGLTKLPDLKTNSAFIRCHGPTTAEVGTLVEDSTGEGLQLFGQSVNCTGVEHEHNTFYTGTGNVSTDSNSTSPVSVTNTNASENSGRQRFKMRKGEHEQNVPPYFNTSDTKKTFTYNFANWGGKLTGGDETRPTNIALNCFIKINR